MEQSKNKRYFGITNFAVENVTSVVILTLMVTFFGVYAYNNIPKEQFPEIVFPQYIVVTAYPGNSAQDIENLVSRPLEKQMKGLRGIKNVKSTSKQDYSIVIAEFNTDVNKDKAFQDVKDAVDKARADLPKDLPVPPDVKDVNLADFPIMTINLAGDFSVDEFRRHAEYLQDEIEGLEEIKEVKIKGLLEREVKVDVDLKQMDARHVSFYDIQQAIGSENLTVSGGEIENNNYRRSFRVVGQFKTVEEIADMVVRSEFGAAVMLKDIAHVSFGYKDPTSFARVDGKQVVALDVVKRSGENLLSASDKIREVLDKAKVKKLPANMQISIFNDQSTETRRSVQELQNHIIIGVVLVIGVLMFFLGLRNGVFVGIAIPLSMLIGYLTLYTSGMTLNIVVLFGLILALGRLVDDGIVVVENIYRHLEMGYSPKEAAKLGTGEVAVSIIASTATTIAAFLPLLFWKSIFGEFMKYLPITIGVTLAGSLFVATVVNPSLASFFMKVEEEHETKETYQKALRSTLIGVAVMAVLAVLGFILDSIVWRNTFLISIGLTLFYFFLLRPSTRWTQLHLLPALDKKYHRFVSWTLAGKRPIMVLGATIAMLLLSFVLVGIASPKVEFFPAADPRYVNVFVDMPSGTGIDATNTFVKELEAKVDKAVQPYKSIVENVLVQVGEGTADPSQSLQDFGATPNKARITISFVESEKRGKLSTLEVWEKVRTALKGYAGVNIIVDRDAQGPPAGKPVNIEVTGDDITKLVVLADDMIRFIESKGIQGLEKLKPDLKTGDREIIVDVNRKAARSYGLSTGQIASALRTSQFGTEVSKYKLNEDEYPIMLRLAPEYRTDLAAMLNQNVSFRDMNTGRLIQIPMNAVVSARDTSALNTIFRKDSDRMITIGSNVITGFNANEVVAQIKTAMQGYKMPDGYTFKFTGEQQQQAEDSAFLAVAFLAAVMLIFLIIVAQFNSLTAPFIIISSVGFSTIGVLLGYVVTGSNIVIIMTMIGLIALAGVVVTNAIVLLDFIILTQRRRHEELGLAEDEPLPDSEVRAAIETAGATRLRPVLLTAITAILGLIPLAIGFNFDLGKFITTFNPHIHIGGDSVAFWGPLAWTIIYGLTFATFLTLVVVPSMYWLTYRFKMKLKSWFKSGDTSKSVASSDLMDTKEQE